MTFSFALLHSPSRRGRVSVCDFFFEWEGCFVCEDACVPLLRSATGDGGFAGVIEVRPFEANHESSGSGFRTAFDG